MIGIVSRCHGGGFEVPALGQRVFFLDFRTKRGWLHILFAA